MAPFWLFLALLIQNIDKVQSGDLFVYVPTNEGLLGQLIMMCIMYNIAVVRDKRAFVALAGASHHFADAGPYNFCDIFNFNGTISCIMEPGEMFIKKLGKGVCQIQSGLQGHNWLYYPQNHNLSPNTFDLVDVTNINWRKKGILCVLAYWAPPVNVKEMIYPPISFTPKYVRLLNIAKLNLGVQNQDLGTEK